MNRESMNFDILIIGAGPAGLSASIRLAHLAKENKKELNICVVEKGSEVGAHILSGAVLETRALDELIPDWKNKESPLKTEAKKDNFFLLTKNKSFKLPTPPQMKNEGNYIISLGNFCRWLAKQAEDLGVNIFPGFAASKILFDSSASSEDKVIGVRTGDLGVDKNGNKLENFQMGYDLFAKQTIFAEGCHGSLTKQLIKKYNLREKSGPQTYGIGLKELWEIKPENHNLGEVIHSIGWPLDNSTYGGSFLYFLENNQVSVGFVIGLDYKNPYISPYDEFQRFKTHPRIKRIFENGKRISYGARALNEGGLQSIPKLTFPGGLLVGCTAGFMNVPKIKGTHTAMKSAMIAAEEIFKNISNEEVKSYEEELKESWVWDELYRVRNIRPAFQKGFWPGLIYSAIDTFIFRGKAPWTFKHHSDHTSLKKAQDSKKIDYPKPDGKITFDTMSSVFISNTNHVENQPCHLQIKNLNIPIDYNLENFDAPEQRYCPAGVYEIVKTKDDQKPKLQINAQNCVHCKTCDIKDPKQNIDWVPPEGGGGPKYPNM